VKRPQNGDRDLVMTIGTALNRDGRTRQEDERERCRNPPRRRHGRPPPGDLPGGLGGGKPISTARDRLDDARLPRLIKSARSAAG
jgi:hypothetical protein